MMNYRGGLVGGQETVEARAKRMARGVEAVRKAITFEQLEAMELAETEWSIEGFLSEGATLLAADPKAGKSLMALDMAIAISQGEQFMGRYEVHKGEVLYLVMEDGAKRVRDRIRRKIRKESRPLPGLHFIFEEFPSFDEGGIEALEAWMVEHPDTRMIVVDTLEHVRGLRSGVDGVYGSDYRAAYPFNRFCQRHHLSGLILHHTNKANVEDPYSGISGSRALPGSVDSLMVLHAALDNSTDGKIFMKGRDIEGQEIGISLDINLLKWTLAPTFEPKILDTRTRILEILSIEREQSPKELSEKIGRSTRTISRILGELEAEGAVEMIGLTKDRKARLVR